MTNVGGHSTADDKPVNKDENLNDILDEKKESKEAADPPTKEKKKKSLLSIFRAKKRKERVFSDDDEIDCISKGECLHCNATNWLHHSQAISQVRRLL